MIVFPKDHSEVMDFKIKQVLSNVRKLEKETQLEKELKNV